MNGIDFSQDFENFLNKSSRKLKKKPKSNILDLIYLFPEITYQKLVEGHPEFHENTKIIKEGSGALIGERPPRLEYGLDNKKYHFYWKFSRSFIRTRVELPDESPLKYIDSARNYLCNALRSSSANITHGNLIKSVSAEGLTDIANDHIPSDDSSDSLELSSSKELAHSSAMEDIALILERSFVVKSSFGNLFEGYSLKVGWNSYWESTMKPLLLAIRDLHGREPKRKKKKVAT